MSEGIFRENVLFCEYSMRHMAKLRDARIVILDEPTSHLDSKTEEFLVHEFLTTCQGRTMIVITHRESLLRMVDRVYRVEGGRMYEEERNPD